MCIRDRDETKETVRLYQQLESERGTVLFNFGLLYLGFALILVLAAVWLGLWFAERLSRPVGRLASAAAQVGAGDLGVQVHEEDGDDEIATLGRVFNPVSYTHLDVYKRQVDDLPLVGRTPAMQALYRLVARVMNADLPVLISVSYTHLDVYKRQGL